jgi:acetyl esterase/lipase
MNRPIIALAVFVLLAPLSAPAAEPQTLKLWPLLAKGSADSETVKDRGDAARPNRFISDVTLPTLTVYLPRVEKASGAAVVVCPGGGYAGVAIDKEGHEVARWLNSIGVAAIVLKYRMPKPDVTKDGPPLPLLDVQRTLRLVRSRAQEWNLKGDRVGVMGFSAGGHLASMAATRFHPADGAATTEAPDTLERYSDRPDFVILIYPVISLRDDVAHAGSRKRLLGDAPTPELIDAFSSDTRVTAQTPPTFLVHAADDGVKCENSLLFRAALAEEKVSCELHLFEKGGHGFGLGTDKPEIEAWPALCETWLKARITPRN